MIGRFGALILLCTMAYGAATAQAAPGSNQQPSREEVLKLMAAMGIQKSIDDSLHQSQLRLIDSARESFLKQNPGLDEAGKKKLDEVFTGTPFFKFEDIAEAVIPVYQKNLRAADVQAGIDFYSSEPGKRLLEKVPEIMREANDQGGQLVEKKMDAYTDELQRKMEALQNQLHPSQPAPPQSGSGGDAGKADDAGKSGEAGKAKDEKSK
jgi:hypothetical protein